MGVWVAEVEEEEEEELIHSIRITLYQIEDDIYYFQVPCWCNG